MSDRLPVTIDRAIVAQRLRDAVTYLHWWAAGYTAKMDQADRARAAAAVCQQLREWIEAADQEAGGKA